MSKRNRGFPQSHSTVNVSGESGSSPIPPSPSSAFLSFPRASSPSSITGFFSKPSRWFSRPTSKRPVSPGTQEPPRSSNSFGSRKAAISGPTDPRPILTGPKSEGRMGVSRSVLDLSLSRTHTSVEDEATPGNEGFGELRSVSRKGWSRSVDDLGKFPSTQTQLVNTSNIKLSTSPPEEESSPPASTKAMIEAYRQNSPHSLHPRYPFPTIQTPAANSPGPLTSAPTRVFPDVAASHAHGRSYSHVPFHSSKLASSSSYMPEQPFPQPLPSATPQSRDRTASLFEREQERTSRSKHSAFGPNNPVNGISGTQPMSSLPLGMDSKRTSQIVHYSGFLNRHPGFQFNPRAGNALSTAFAKGWKPYKAVLKGSKLYFYKPPSDRSVAIKELFPQGLEPIVDERPEPVQEEPEPSYRTTGREREDVKKQTRLYRGRATHPELSVGEDGSVTRGSSDALIHEAVFGTSFNWGDPDEAERRWKIFASSIVLCLPRLIGRVKFENEFTRYVSYFISDADDADLSRLESRTAWLAKEYLRHQGTPASEATWAAFRTEYVPSLSVFASSTASDSKASFPEGDGFPQHPLASDIPPFSAVVTPPRASFSRPSFSQPRANHESFWAAVEEEGLTSDIFLKLDSSLIARSLGIFHRNVLSRHLQHFVAACLIDHEGDNEVEARRDTLEQSPFSIFFGSEEHPQWLTRFIVVQLLNAHGTATEASNFLVDLTPQVSKTHLRAELIGKWARVGEHCRLTGDHCSWKAIEAALCSRPIARLERVWRRVETLSLQSIDSWIRNPAECPVSEPRLTPWGGDISGRVAGLLQKARLESGVKEEQWDAAFLQQILDCVEPIVDIFAQSNTDVKVDGQSDDTSRFARIWQSIAEQQMLRPPNINQYLSQSLAAEPREKGRFEPLYWRQPSNISSIHTLLPLLFVEPLPTITLIHRDYIYRGKKDSMDMVGTHPGLDTTQVTRMIRMKSSAEARRSGDVRGTGLPMLSSSDSGGLILELFNGELLLVVPKSLPESQSRPPSSLETGLERRTSQIRVSSPGLERKSSVARRNSLPSISQRSSLALSEPTSEGILRVMVKAGTLERLVNVLISGVEGVQVAVTDDNGEMPLREGRTKTLKLDRAEFRTIWWSVFRSFVSPLVLFELLRKRFLHFEASPGVSSYAPRTRLDILLTINQWIEDGGGALDALGDTELFDSMKIFLTATAITKVPPGTTEDDRPSWIEIENARQVTLAAFTSQSYRPKSLLCTVRNSVLAFPFRNYGRHPPLIDDIDPETLVNNLDSLAATALRCVTREDFFVTVDLLETQSFDRTGWFLSQDPSTSYDEIEIQTIYSHLQQVETSPLISELGQESFYKLLPPSIRSLIRAHAVIRKWALGCIVAPQLGLPKRQARAETLLKAIEICRLRMSEVPAPVMISSQQSVRSFVEMALISALISPESRIFSVMWHQIATTRRASTDSIAALLSNPVTKSTTDRGFLAVDLGWVFERILEVISVPNIIDTNGDASNLINFEKRRHLFDIVMSAYTVAPTRSHKEHAELERIDIDRLNHMDRDVIGPPFDARLLREDAYLESVAQSSQATQPKKSQRPFLKLTQAQQEKCKRDKLLRDRLLREKRAEQQRTEKREEDLNKAMAMGQPNSQGIKHQRSRRTMSSAFFQLMRPLSTAFSSENIYASTQRRTAAELDFEPTGKPVLVFGLVGATVIPFNNNARLYTFYLTTEDGGRFLLQASTRATLNLWLNVISKTAKSSTAKRLTYVADAPKPQLSDHIQSPCQAVTRHPTKVFGVELEFLLQREAEGTIQPGAVPRVLEQCLSEIEARGLQEVGLYRVPGSTSAINALKEEFNSGGEITFFSREYVDIWAVCDTVKSFFRELPHPIFPERSYFEVLRVMKIPDFEERLTNVRDVVHGLPIHHFDLLRRICEHLERVTDYEENNHMTAEALSVLFNPSLLRSPLNNFGLLMQNMTFTSQLLQTLIIHFHRVFDELEADADVDQEDVETNLDHQIIDLRHVDSRSSPVPTDAIHDHGPDLEPLSSARTPDTEAPDFLFS